MSMGMSMSMAIFKALSALMLATAGLPYDPAPLLEASSVSSPEPWLFERTGVFMTSPIASGERVDGKADKSIDPEPAPVPGGEDAAAVALLDTLESSADDLRAFTSSIHYVTYNVFLEQTVIRKGDIVYHVDPDRRKSFSIRFELTIEQGAMRKRRRDYIFRDGWIVEVDHKDRQFIKRQIVSPGKPFDPLKLGEGPIPLPIGQSRDEVMRRFEVALIELPEAGALAKLRAGGPVDGIRLVPRAGTPEAKDYKSIDIFYDRATRLPVGIEVIEKNDNRKTARLEDLRRNPVLDDEQLERLDIDPPAPGEKWHVDIRPLGRS